MWWIVGLVAWFVCGVLAYGLKKNSRKQFYQFIRPELSYNNRDEDACLSYAFYGGAVGLALTILILSSEPEESLGLCFRMPRELCGPRKTS